MVHMKMQSLSINTWSHGQEYMSHVRHNRRVSITDSGLEAGAGVEAGVVAGGGAAGEGRRAGAHLPPQNPKSLWYVVNSALCPLPLVQGAMHKSRSIQTYLRHAHILYVAAFSHTFSGQRGCTC